MERRMSVLSDIKDVSELLNGARVDQMRLTPNGSRMRCEIELTRACPELRRVERKGWFTRATTPSVTSRLELHGVTNVVVQHLRETPPGQVPLLSCEAVEGGYACTVTAPDGLQYVLQLEQLDGQFADIGTPVEEP